MFTVWWVWMVAGFVLGIFELLVPVFIFLGFAIGALVVGALLGLGVLSGSAQAMLLVFAVTSVLAWLVLRRLMGPHAGQVKVVEKDINEV